MRPAENIERRSSTTTLVGMYAIIVIIWEQLNVNQVQPEAPGQLVRRDLTQAHIFRNTGEQIV
jgi:hypothetical protein